MIGRFPFITYNPFTDQRIGTLHGCDQTEDGENHIPDYLHSAVIRAKNLIGHNSIEKLRKDAVIVEKMVREAILLRGFGSESIADKIGPHHGSTAFLMIYYKAVGNGGSFTFDLSPWGRNGELYKINLDENLTPERWSTLFGVLALYAAGDLINSISPSPEYLKAIKYLNQRWEDEGLYFSENKINTHKLAELIPNVPEIGIILEETDESFELSEVEKAIYREHYAADAIQAVGIGEGILMGARYKTEKQSAGAAPPKKHQRLYELFASWAINQSDNGGYHSTEDAVNYGFIPYLKDMERQGNLGGEVLSTHIKSTTHRRLKRFLEDHCLNTGNLYPFARKRSKRKLI